MPTDDGALIAGEPHSAATWFPANEHPRDKASYSFRISVPRGVEAIANGVLSSGVDTRRPVDLALGGERADGGVPLDGHDRAVRDLRRARSTGTRYLDAIDPDLLKRPKPRTGTRYAVTGVAQPGYQRLLRTIDRPRGRREALVLRQPATPSQRRLLLRRGPHRPAPTTGPRCATSTATPSGDDGLRLRPVLLEIHPFLAHYCAASGRRARPRGHERRLDAARLASDADERWVVDLSPYAGRSVEVALTLRHRRRLPVRRRRRRRRRRHGGAGSTSFEDDGDRSTAGPSRARRRGSEPNPRLDRRHGRAGRRARPATSPGRRSRASPRSSTSWPASSGRTRSRRPARSSTTALLGFALENQTRPIYSRVFFEDRATPRRTR